MGLTTRYSCLAFYGNNRIRTPTIGRRIYRGFYRPITLLHFYWSWYSFFVIVYFVKRNERKKVEDGELDNSIQEENSSNGGMTIVVIVWIFVMILGYFSNRHSKETEKRVEDFIEQKKMEQIDPHSQ